MVVALTNENEAADTSVGGVICTLRNKISSVTFLLASIYRKLIPLCVPVPCTGPLPATMGET